MSDTETREGVEACMMFEGLEDVFVPCRLVKADGREYFMYDNARLQHGAQRYSWRFGLQGRLPEKISLRHAFFPLCVQGHGWSTRLWLLIEGYNQPHQRLTFIRREDNRTFMEIFPHGVVISAATLALSVLEKMEAIELCRRPFLGRLAVQTNLMGDYIQRSGVPVLMVQESCKMPGVWPGGIAEWGEAVRLITFPDGSVLALKQSGMLVL